ncbi:prolyl oligopeptidase family serine peptidase [Candidatus Kapabacteria bacterium]|nr:prolyl oligopeptidase family serine peptidase [Candidatus Kapabacteria bacterium]
MKKILLGISIIVLAISCEKKGEEISKINYPESKKLDSSYTRHDVTIQEPYVWLEDDRSPETEAWVIAQNKVTQDYLAQIPYKAGFLNRLKELNNYPKYGAPSQIGDKYIFTKNDGLQNQSVYYIQDGLDGEPSEFFNPNKLSDDGTVSAGISGVSGDDKYVSVNISKSGSDWQEIKLIDVATGEMLPDVVEWVKFSGVSFFKDGFFYSRYDAPKEGTEYSGKNEFHKLYYHKIGTQQAEDKLVLVYNDKPQRNLYAGITEDEKYLIINVHEGTGGNMLLVKDLEANPKVDDLSNMVTIVNNFEGENNIVGSMGNKLLMMTSIGNPQNKIVEVTVNGSNLDMRDLILPKKEGTIRSVSKSGGFLFVNHLIDVNSVIEKYDYDGKLLEKIDLPGIGSAGGFSGKDDATTLFYSFSSFNYPPTIFKYDVASSSSEVFRKPDLDFNPDDYEVKQQKYPSKDGTMIPMFIVHKKGIELDGTNPTFLYAYGGFNISLTPSFNPSLVAMLEQGGVYAMANLRGGGEFGEAWHQAGMKMNKQNVFDDFISAAEYLISNKYTSSEKLAISGRSNGGLLIGACMTQRPDLYKVAFPAVGVLDMLKFHQFTIGWAWKDDYGDPEEEEMFNYLKGYSPLHNLKEGVSYPATMVTTADHDDRVVPAHSFKFAARLQEVHSGGDPVLIRIETKAGHGSGKSLTKKLEEEADMFSFMFYNMGEEPVFNTK